MPLSSFILLFLTFISAAAGTPKHLRCLPSGDESAINQAVANGGRSAVVSLCRGSVHRLNSTILFTAPRQTLTTEGNPTGRDRALLIVEGQDQAIAIQADCKECSFATIRSLEVNGNRPLLLRVPVGGALLELGNGEGQIVRDCKLYEPRGWSALHFREGDLKQCRKALVVNNEIGPCGEEWDDEYDGTVETATPPFGNPRADGISLACQESLVERNTVTDTTDGAIVLFGSGDSEVRENHVYSRTRVVLGGINLVDYEPWAGDYSGVHVHHNTFHALGRYFKVGIVIGPSSWSDDTDSTVCSATVTDNTFHGDRFGYGIVVSSVTDFTVLRNQVDDSARFSGVRGPRCPRAPENGRPTAFLINRGSARGTFQDDFLNGEVQHIICLHPPAENGQAYKPWRLRDSADAVATKPAPLMLDSGFVSRVGQCGPDKQDVRLAEALVNYQLRLLTAMDGINDKIERVNRPDEVDSAGRPSTYEKTGIVEMDAMEAKLDGLEAGDRKLQSELDAVQADFEAMADKLKKGIGGNRPLIEGVFRSVAALKGTIPAPLGQRVHEREDESDDPQRTENGMTIGPMAAVLIGSVAMVVAALSFMKRWRSKRTSAQKSGKLF